MNKTALVVNSKSEISETGLSLKELQTAGDGLIEAIDLSENLTMWVNEEFLFRAEPDPNPIATAFFQTFARGEYAIQGTVVFTGGTDSDGNTLGLGEKEQELIRQFQQMTLMILARA
jgi:hypothetical protein